MARVYKICSKDEWRVACQDKAFRGSAADLRDGFIHLSAAYQLRETAARHFAGREGLVLVAFRAEDLEPALKWEKSRGGDLFPHVYGSLPVDLALFVKSLPLDGGHHRFPPEIPL